MQGRRISDEEAWGRGLPGSGFTWEFPAEGVNPGDTVAVRISGDVAEVRVTRAEPVKPTCGAVGWGPSGFGSDMTICGAPATWHGADGIWRCERHAKEQAEAHRNG